MTNTSMSRLRSTWVVMPARDEAAHVGAALDALAAAARAVLSPVHVVVVDDGSTDATAAIVAARFERWSYGNALCLPGPGAGAGWARRIGLDHALAAAGAVQHAPPALIATTDADSRVPAEWLVHLHTLVDDGHQVLAGDIRLDAAADPRLAVARDHRLTARLEAVRRRDPGAEHPHFGGANVAFTAEALSRLTPLPTPRALEDDALRARCEAVGIPIYRSAAFPVTTSSRTTGRAELGLAAALATDAERLGLSESTTT